MTGRVAFSFFPSSSLPGLCCVPDALGWLVLFETAGGGIRTQRMRERERESRNSCPSLSFSASPFWANERMREKREREQTRICSRTTCMHAAGRERERTHRAIFSHTHAHTQDGHGRCSRTRELLVLSHTQSLCVSVDVLLPLQGRG